MSKEQTKSQQWQTGCESPTRACAGQSWAARNVYSYGKDKHQAISKSGSACLFAIKAHAYISMNMSCILLLPMVHCQEWIHRTAVMGHLSIRTNILKIIQPGVLWSAAVNGTSLTPHHRGGLSSPPHYHSAERRMLPRMRFNPVRFKPSVLQFDGNALFLFRAGSEVWWNLMLPT